MGALLTLGGGSGARDTDPGTPLATDNVSDVTGHCPACVICTTLSRTVIRPVRAVVVAFAATMNDTGLSPRCGVDVVIVIHGTSDCAVHRHAFCVGPPHVFGWAI